MRKIQNKYALRLAIQDLRIHLHTALSQSSTCHHLESIQVTGTNAQIEGGYKNCATGQRKQGAELLKL